RRPRLGVGRNDLELDGAGFVGEVSLDIDRLAIISGENVFDLPFHEDASHDKKTLKDQPLCSIVAAHPFQVGGSVAVPVSQMYTVATYVLGQRLRGAKRYPLVLMLEPLFRCNLACAGCGKIQYPDHVLDKRLTPKQ